MTDLSNPLAAKKTILWYSGAAMVALSFFGYLRRLLSDAFVRDGHNIAKKP